MNARFWTYHHGWVKITLKPGQTLTISEWGRTDEGWSSSDETYTHDGEGVRLEWGTDGVDCDGRLSEDGESYLPLASIGIGGCVEDEQEVTYNDWLRGPKSKRDYSAEAAGY